MPDTNIIELKGHTARTAVHSSGKAQIIFSLFFVGIGAFIVLISMGVIPVEPESFNAPRFIVGFTGGIFLVAGLMLLTSGIKSAWVAIHRKRLREMYPRESWRLDHVWSQEGTADSSVVTGWKTLSTALFFSLFMVPFNYWAFFSEHGNFFVTAITSLFDLIIFAVFCGGFYQIWRGIKYGACCLRWEQFPYFLGDTFKARFSSGRPIGQFNSMTITLRCIVNVEEVRGSGDDQSRQVICYQHYCDTIEFNQAGMTECWGEVPVTFVLPQGDYGTSFDGKQPRYWELEINADTPGIDFHATFLVPVFSAQS